MAPPVHRHRVYTGSPNKILDDFSRILDELKANPTTEPFFRDKTPATLRYYWDMMVKTYLAENRSTDELAPPSAGPERVLVRRRELDAQTFSVARAEAKSWPSPPRGISSGSTGERRSAATRPATLPTTPHARRPSPDAPQKEDMSKVMDEIIVYRAAKKARKEADDRDKDATVERIPRVRKEASSLSAPADRFSSPPPPASIDGSNSDKSDYEGPSVVGEDDEGNSYNEAELQEYQERHYGKIPPGFRRVGNGKGRGTRRRRRSTLRGSEDLLIA